MGVKYVFYGSHNQLLVEMQDIQWGKVFHILNMSTIIVMKHDKLSMDHIYMQVSKVENNNKIRDDGKWYARSTVIFVYQGAHLGPPQ